LYDTFTFGVSTGAAPTGGVTSVRGCRVGVTCTNITDRLKFTRKPLKAEEKALSPGRSD